MNAGALNPGPSARISRMDRHDRHLVVGDDGDLEGVGEAAKGYRALSWNVPVATLRSCRTSGNMCSIRKRPEIGEGEFGSVFYQRRRDLDVRRRSDADRAGDNIKIINAGQMRWGLENLRTTRTG